MHFKSILLAFLFSLFTTGLFAHAYWLQSSATGVLNKEHQVSVIFAEPAGAKEPTDGEEWSAMKGYTLWLLTPSQQKIKLETKVEQDHYTASFIPEEQGSYLVFMENEAIAVMGGWRMLFYASVPVQVGSAKTVLPVVPESKLSLVVAPAKKGTLQLKLNPGAIDITKMKLTAFDHKGAKEDLVLGKDGNATFTPKGKGLYYFEAVYLNKEASGTFEGNEYKNLYYAVTTSVTAD